MPKSPSDSGNKVDIFKNNTIPTSFVEEDVSKELAVDKDKCLTCTVPKITKTAHFKSPLQQTSSIGELLLLSDYFIYIYIYVYVFWNFFSLEIYFP